MNRIALIFAVFMVCPACALADPDWYALLYLGQYSPKEYDEVPFSSNWDLKQQYMGTVGLGREMARLTRLWGWEVDLGMELEGLVAHHWGRYNRDYQEFAGSFNLRWRQFPWNQYLPTTLAHGIGLSYATLVPEHEVLFRRGKSAQLLAFLMWDVTLSLPSHPEWAVFFRVHHRSGAFGTFDGVYGAANYPCLGIRYLF